MQYQVVITRIPGLGAGKYNINIVLELRIPGGTIILVSVEYIIVLNTWYCIMGQPVDSKMDQGLTPI